MDNSTIKTVVMVHGLWMTGMEMGWMARAFKKLGYRVLFFRYPTVKIDLTKNIENFARFLQQTQKPYHLFCHSLGGLLALHTLHKHQEINNIRMVAVGTPFLGSHTARKIAEIPWLGAKILGGSMDQALLYGGPKTIPKNIEMGIIAGNHSLGISRLLFSPPLPNDGTIAVAETKIANALHIEVNNNHMGLVFSQEVAELSYNFFINGRFTN
ncbi:MAG: alpha/beta fold hydrolase [Magnetococcales bacterium]|nr:alpha/beta fold hydrolase [Magnetococcales bacterium]